MLQRMIEINPFRAEDRERWEVLARGYKTFYETVLPDSQYDETWRRLMSGEGVYGFAARFEGNLVGIAHYLFHAHAWMDDVCYLQDLFVDEAARGHGVARALIERVAEAARERGASLLYWQTRADNTTARALYDKVARHKGFIRYDYRL
jgi:ribosomal protein S18 acetylase RimI-like enzyme